MAGNYPLRRSKTTTSKHGTSKDAATSLRGGRSGTRTGTDLYQPYMHAGPGDHELGQDDGDGGMAHLATQDLEDLAGFLPLAAHETL